jgi:hypothetical protein
VVSSWMHKKLIICESNIHEMSASVHTLQRNLCISVSQNSSWLVNVDFSHAMIYMYLFDTPNILSLNNISILQWKWKSSEIILTVEDNSLFMEIASWHGHHTHTHKVRHVFYKLNSGWEGLTFVANKAHFIYIFLCILWCYFIMHYNNCYKTKLSVCMVLTLPVSS